MTDELGSFVVRMSWMPWQSVQRALSVNDSGPPFLTRETVFPWKSLKYVCVTRAEIPYFFISVSSLWQRAHMSVEPSRKAGDTAFWMLWTPWHVVQVGTSRLFSSRSAD